VIKKIKNKWLLILLVLVIAPAFFYLNFRIQGKSFIKDDNLKLEAFLQTNNKRGGSFECKYSHVYDGSYNRRPNSHQYVRVKFEKGTLLISGSERSVMDAWALPFKYVFDEKTKTLKSEGVVKYYLMNKRKIIIGENPESHVGPIRTSIKDMPYKLEIKFEDYPFYLGYFYVRFEATSDDGNLNVGISCPSR
jgi:hypothetical protein